MKYMTKKWYNTMQQTSYHILLKEDKNASEYSEEYFNYLYEKAQNDSLYFWDVKTLEIGIKHFNEFFKRQLAELKNNLPDSILNEVSDIRVLALHHATRKTIEKITEFCNNNDKIVKETVENYDKLFNEQFKENKPNFASEFSFHDCDVISFDRKDNDYIVKLDNEQGFTNINTIIFKNAKIIKQEKGFVGGWWLYEEIYKKDKEYEIHVLLRNRKDNLIDFIIECTEVILK